MTSTHTARAANSNGEPGGADIVRLAGLISAPLLAVLVYLVLPRETRDGAGAVVEVGLTHAGRATAGAAVLMAIWWMTEALPIEVTGLVPLAVFPVTGIAKMDAAAAPYATDIIFLFLGGMLLGQGMERWGLHRRFALHTVKFVGSRPTRLVGGFLLATGFISMWVSNTAATVMMLPIGASVVGLVVSRMGNERCRDFGPAVMLAIAFGASIGGVGTIIGTPPIAQYAGFMKRSFDHQVTFLEWIKLGLPVLVVVLPVTWLVLTRVAFRLPRGEAPGVREHIDEDLKSLGKMNRGEGTVLAAFVCAAAAWIGVPLVAGMAAIKGTAAESVLRSVTDAGVAIGAAIVLFVIPVNLRERRFVLSWQEAQKVPWGILLLFGGGLSLAAAVKANGVDAYIASLADGLAGVPVLAIMFICSLVTIFLTELCSNTALVAAALPVASAVAERLGVPPAALLVTVTLSASLGFMLPAGTAPNALVFASGHVTMRQMMRAGVWLDLICAAASPLMVWGAMKAGALPGM